MPCCLPAAAARTLPVPVNLNRFLALDLVFSLGILFSYQYLNALKKAILVNTKAAGHALPDRLEANFITGSDGDGKLFGQV